MSAKIDVSAWMNFPNNRDNRVLEGILKRSNKNYGKAFSADSDVIYWSAESLGLDRVKAYRDAAPEIQKKILADCSYALLREAFAIERAGMAFASKMVLLSDDLESRILYSQFAAQEAAHYQAIAAYIPEEPSDLASDPFLSVLKDAIEQGDRMTLTLIIQVFLEGWGLLHYKKLQKDCLNPGLADEFRQILQDEAHHHGSGIALLNLDNLTEDQKNHGLGILKTLLSMVAAGPWNVATILQKHLLGGGQSPTVFFAELGHEVETPQKLQQLKRILQVGGAQSFVDQLDSENFFQLSIAQ